MALSSSTFTVGDQILIIGQRFPTNRQSEDDEGSDEGVSRNALPTKAD